MLHIISQNGLKIQKYDNIAAVAYGKTDEYEDTYKIKINNETMAIYSSERRARRVIRIIAVKLEFSEDKISTYQLPQDKEVNI